MLLVNMKTVSKVKLFDKKHALEILLLQPMRAHYVGDFWCKLK